MKLVIDISENDYELACRWPDALIAVYAHAIKNGKPLPKGHGDLVDRDAIQKAYNCGGMDYSMIDALYDAPIIIEEDKVESENV